MRFGFFNPEQKPTFVQTPKNVEDTEKHKEIFAKLCEKRKALEWNMANRANAAYKEELDRHLEMMETFGITEVDYAIYCAKKANKDIH